MKINPSSPKGVATTPQTVFTLVLKIAQPRGKIAPVHPFPSFILSNWEVMRSWCDPVIFKLDYSKNIWSDIHSKLVCKLEWPFSNIFCKKSHENRMFLQFLRKNQFLPIFYAQNSHFSIFVGALTLWRHSDIRFGIHVWVHFQTQSLPKPKLGTAHTSIEFQKDF